MAADGDPIALRVRAMNMTYESTKERGALMVVPTDMTSSLGGTLGMAAAAFDGPGPQRKGNGSESQG
jgi:hypothetical protein